ncbi:MAG: hypothetical protein ACR2JV_02550 [Gaiellales bacterium]
MSEHEMIIAAAGLPADREFSEEFLRLRELGLEWIETYYDRDHMRRAADWVLHLDPDASEPLIFAAMTHDLERSVPGGPVLDKVNMRWDDVEYNTAHCERSVEVVSRWLADHDAAEDFIEGIRVPIREHEFGGSPIGDVMQAADSISFLECNGPLVANWVLNGDCSLEKGHEKLHWMRDRVRLERARPIAAAQCAAVLAEVDRRLAEARD